MSSSSVQHSRRICRIAAGFDDDDAPVPSTVAESNPEEDIIPIDNPLIDGLGFGGTQARPAAPSSSQDYDLDDIFKMLGN